MSLLFALTGPDLAEALRRLVTRRVRQMRDGVEAVDAGQGRDGSGTDDPSTNAKGDGQ